MARLKLALDKSSRVVDENGYLHVAVNNISKAVVNPYNGDEIPDFEKLGLDPKRVYFLLRDPQELEKAAPTFNNLPLLDFHEPISAEEFDEKREFVVGATGDQARFQDPYLQNSLVVWDAGAIERIDTREQVELSCAYRYEIDLTPGKYEGVAYDGVMRNLRGNHVALVDEGRAGPDVVVSDAKPKEKTPMKKKLNPRAIATRGALLAHIRPKLAADQQLKINDLNALISTITAKDFKTQKVKLAEDVKKFFKTRLAQDADLDDIMDLLDNLEDGEGEELEDGAEGVNKGIQKGAPNEISGLDDDDGAEDGDEPGKALLALLQAQNLPDDVLTQVAALLDQLSAPKAADAFPPKKGEPVKPTAAPAIGKPAMDAAIRAAEQATITRMNGIRRAEEKVEPLLGKIQPMESAEAIYKLALDTHHVETTNIHPSALEPLVDMLLAHHDSQEPALVAMDGAGADSYEKKFNASRLRRF
jgi:hypothetical protein